MNVKEHTYKHMGDLPENQVFPANTGDLVALFGIIVVIFSLSMLAFFAY